MRRNPILAVWLLGLLLAALLYAVGPGGFIGGLYRMADAFGRGLDAFLISLTVQGYALMQALALAAFVMFVILGLMAARRGLRARGALVLVTMLFLLLTYGPLTSDIEEGAARAQGWDAATEARARDGARWLGALALAGIGAVVMTNRLRHAPPPPPSRAPRGHG